MRQSTGRRNWIFWAINARERAAERDAREMLPRVKTLLGAKAMRQPW